MSDGNEVADREALAREIWAGEEIVDADPLAGITFGKPEDQQHQQKAPEEPAQAAPAESDPWAGVPAALRDQFEGLRAKVEQTETLEQRLKQAERRLGTVQNELHAARQVAKATPPAPTPEQIAADEQTRREWDDVRSNFPELASATERRLAAQQEEIRRLIPDQEATRRQMDEQLSAAKIEMAENFVALRHPDWVAVRDSQEFKAWHEQQGRHDSMNPIEVIAILDDYKKHKSTQKTPKQIEAERQQRLEQSQSTEGRNIRPPKSQDDMSPAELRAAIAKQVWSE